MASRAGPSQTLRDNEISEYLDIDNLSDVSGVDYDIDIQDFRLSDKEGVTVQDVFVSSRSNSPVSTTAETTVPPDNASTSNVVPWPSGDAPTILVDENNEGRPSKRRKAQKHKETFFWVHNKDFSPQLFEFDSSNSGISPLFLCFHFDYLGLVCVFYSITINFN